VPLPSSLSDLDLRESRYLYFDRLLQQNRTELFYFSQLVAARLICSGRQKELHVSVHGPWWQDLTAGYRRVSEWLKLTASELTFPAPEAYPLLI